MIFVEEMVDQVLHDRTSLSANDVKTNTVYITILFPASPVLLTAQSNVWSVTSNAVSQTFANSEHVIEISQQASFLLSFDPTFDDVRN